MRHISETVQHEVYNSTAKNSQGDPVDAWKTTVDLGVYAFDPGGTSEPVIPGQDRVITTPTIFVPTATVIGHRDRITVTGEPNPFEVDGNTRQFRNPYDSSMNGNVINLKAVSG